MPGQNFETQGGARDPANDNFGVMQIPICQDSAMWL